MRYFLLIIAAISVLSNTDIRFHSQSKISQERTIGDHCPVNWTRYDRTKSCFLVIQQRLRWIEAETLCRKYGAHLASVVDEYENAFAFGVAKNSNLSIPTVWLGRLVKLSRSGAYEWNDGSVGRHAGGFRETPSGTDLCLTMWLDFDEPDGSWNEWDCNYATGYSALCKKSFKYQTSVPVSESTTAQSLFTHVETYRSRRCCVSTGPAPMQCAKRCATGERCIPDDLNCWTKICPSGVLGWCLPVAAAK